MKRHRVLACLSLVLAACVEGADIPTVPEQILEISISANPLVLERGETTRLVVTLKNPLEEQVRLNFPSTCQVRLFVRDHLGRIVAPANGTYNCATVPSQITLEAGQSTTFPFDWSGEAALGPPGSGTPLPPGEYFASADLNADGYVGIAFPLRIILN